MNWRRRHGSFRLRYAGTTVGPRRLSVPALAVVNRRDTIAPLASIQRFAECAATQDVRVIEYPGEPGVGPQHIALLIGRQARARVWPEIGSWIERVDRAPLRRAYFPRSRAGNPN